jgi:hypothetical protein
MKRQRQQTTSTAKNLRSLKLRNIAGSLPGMNILND